MSTLGNIGYLTQLLAAMRQDQTGTVTPPTDAELISGNILPYDADLYAIGGLTGTTGLLRKTGLNAWILDTAAYLTTITSSQVTTALGYNPVTDSRTLTINGVTYDLTANRSWTIAAGVTSFNTRTGAITLLSTDITSTLGYTPYNATNPAGYISSYTETDPTVGSHIKAITTTNISNWNTAYGWGNHASAGYLTGITSGQVTTALGYTPENAANKGVANGYASLDGSGLVPSTQLPSYVDDVLEYTNLASFPATGTTGKIYIDLATNKVYRWSGTVYIEVSPTVGTIWGGITGTLANQTDLQTALDAKVPTTRTLTINGTAFDLSANRSWTINSMVYPAAGIAVSTGTAWAASITDNSTNWNTAYSSRISSLTVTGSSGAATLVSNVLNIPTYTLAGLGGITASFLSGGTGITYNSGTGVIATTITQYTDALARAAISLTTTGSSGASTYSSATGVLNVPTYTLSGLGGQPLATNLTSLAGLSYVSASFVKMTAAGTFTLDTNTYYLASNPSGYTSNTGTVTSVSGTGTVSGLSLSGTVTTTGNITLGGTLAVTASNFSSQTANTFLAAPNGLAGVPTFRTIVAADIPTLNQNTTGSAGSVANSLILKADTGTTEGTDLYTYNGSAAKTLNIVAGSNITITKVAGQWTIAGSAGGTSLNGTGFVRMSGTTPSYITGTASQFLKADGSVDSSSYLTSTITSIITLSGNSAYFKSSSTLGFIVNNSADTLNNLTVKDPSGDVYIRGQVYVGGNGNSTGTQVVYNSGTWGININGSAASITGVYGGTLTSSQITTGLGYTPYNSTNPNGYISSYTETDTLASVTGRGNSTSTNIGSTSSGPLNFVTNGNIGTWIGGVQDATSGWSLSSATIGFKSDNNTYATIGIAAANGLLYFGRTTTTVGTLTSWLEVNNGGTANFKLARPQYNGNTILDAANYNSYAPTLTGTGASGTWGINVTGSSASTTGNSATTSQRYFSGDIGTAGMGRFTGWYNGNATTALAAEIGVSAGEAYVITYNRGTSSYGNINIEAANVRLNPQGGGALTTNGNTILHAGNYTSYSPSLTGTGASGTWGISISGNAATATSATTATNWGSYGGVPAAGTSFGTANTIGRSDVNGYTFFYYINSSTANSENPAVSQVITTNGTDNYYRKSSIASFTGYVQSNASGNWGINITGNAATATSATSAGSTTYLAALGNYVWSASTLPTGFSQGIQCSFVSSSQGFQSYGSVMTMKTYSGGGGSLQLYTPYSPTYGGSSLQVRFGNYDGGDVWTSWKTLLQSDNYNSYAPTLTGTGASGTWSITSSQVTINYNNDSNSTYQMLWGAGNSVYGTAGIYCNPSTDTVYATQFIENSSIRFKDNVVTVTDSLNKVLELRGVTYTRKGTQVAEMGVIAEEVEKIIPEVVKYENGDIEGVNYGRLTAVLIEAVKEQQKQINELKELLNAR